MGGRGASIHIFISAHKRDATREATRDEEAMVLCWVDTLAEPSTSRSQSPLEKNIGKEQWENPTCSSCLHALLHKLPCHTLTVAPHSVCPSLLCSTPGHLHSLGAAFVWQGSGHCWLYTHLISLPSKGCWVLALSGYKIQEKKKKKPSLPQSPTLLQKTSALDPIALASQLLESYPTVWINGLTACTKIVYKNIQP